MTDETALTVREAAGLAGYAGGDGQRRMIALADEFSALCKERAKQKRPWLVQIGPGQHLTIEAWQYLGQRAGIIARTADLRELRHPITGDYEGAAATAEVFQVSTGQLLGRAEQVCYADEVVKKKDGTIFQRWLDEEGKPSRHAIVGMAQTRAQSRALASVLRFLAELAGVEGTPADEMDGVRGEAAKPSVKPPTRKPDKPAAKSEVLEGYIEDVEHKSGNKADGTPWNRYGIKIDGAFYGTFSDTLGALAKGAHEDSAPVRLTWKQDGNYRNVVELERVSS